MRLRELLAHLPGATPLDPGDPEIRGVTCDSRRVRPGDLFAAVPGARVDGHAFAPAAAAAGASVCLVARDVSAPGAVRVRVPDPEAALGRASSAFHGHPSRAVRVVGITGTNGKTTTAFLVQHILASEGRITARLGTVGYAFPSGEEPAPLTTPDAETLQAALARARAEGAQDVVMEVSSHALARQRVEGTRFACVAFTNLTQDHLDYHGTLEAYFEAKRSLFTRYAPEAPAAVNADDPFGRRLLGELGDRAVPFGVGEGEGLRVLVDEEGPWGFRGRVRLRGREAPLALPLAGRFNAANAACALACAVALGVDLARAARDLASAPAVPGRIEAVPNRLGIGVYVDYAHTPDALDRVLETVAAVTRGRVIAVFGCGGDRDRTKRAPMARAAARWARAIVLTADNSRSEPTERILDEIEAGMPEGWRRTGSAAGLGADRAYARVPDRAEAIRWAVAAARPGDAVVIAGKGHETTQTLGDRVLPFDDRVEARRALAEREAAA
ncbi:MAG: UDP-N-acetylmuramoyl-L-alanyl-D-glutamate--2,6-diaminopimelate ligase [Candidatus Dadabacteria bacterium]|nr:MAG: UDP-N-acetylmuramoyl-L-alanyl-D-glutamate--2,6-diaminopimelate ligase [Candidatus Dadabacteria bacterium]